MFITLWKGYKDLPTIYVLFFHTHLNLILLIYSYFWRRETRPVYVWCSCQAVNFFLKWKLWPDSRCYFPVQAHIAERFKFNLGREFERSAWFDRYNRDVSTHFISTTSMTALKYLKLKITVKNFLFALIKS